MPENASDFDLYLPTDGSNGKSKGRDRQATRKFTSQLKPGSTQYDLVHNLATQDVIVQTRIAGRIREGGISIVDENTVRFTFGGTLNEPMDVVIIG